MTDERRQLIKDALTVVALAVFFLLLLYGASQAEDGPRTSGCPQHLLDGKAPVVAVVSGDAVELCSDAFVTLWSPATRDPVYSAEHLTAESLAGADRTTRVSQFHADSRLPSGRRAELSDYVATPYDRGHMAPAHDMPTPEAMHQSFLLSNMVPQVPAFNRGEWSKVEAAARSLVVSVYHGQGWVVTGPLFAGRGAVGLLGQTWVDVGEPRKLQGDVAVPTYLFKAVYVPGDTFGNQTVAGAWVVRNTESPLVRFVSLTALRTDYGVDAFPGLPADVKDRATLPPAVLKRTSVSR